MLKMICTVLALTGLCTTLLAQDQWQTVIQQDQVHIESREVVCKDEANGITKQYIQLRLTNPTGKTIEVSYYRQLWYDDNCISCDKEYEEYQHSYTLLPHATMVGDCERPVDKGLMLFAGMPDVQVRKLTKFKLAQLETGVVK